MNRPKVSITVSLFVKKDQNQSVSELASDLKALINQLKNDKNIANVFSEGTFPILVPQTKLLEQKDGPCQVKFRNLLKKRRQIQPSRKKENED